MIEWYNNGQKKWEKVYKDDEIDGNELGTYWGKNDEKGFKGKFISRDELFRLLVPDNSPSLLNGNYFIHDHSFLEYKSYKNGKRDGLFTSWYEDGEVDWEIDGLSTELYKNGQKWEEGTYKDGKKDGLWTGWYKNGQKFQEETYKDGKLNGFYTNWYENGPKWEEGTYKDGEEDGLWTRWDENGQKRWEGTYKDGKLISKKEWNEDGSVKE